MISLSNAHPFMREGNGQQSPYLEELAVFAGSQTPYESAQEYLRKFLRFSLSDSTIFRRTNQYGEQVEPVLTSTQSASYQDQTRYVMVDGSMVLTREEGYKEVKLARIFAHNQRALISSEQAQEARGYIHQSLYIAHLGEHEAFEQKLQEPLNQLEPLAKEVVVVSDGARWIKDYFQTFYPQARLILDVYHVKEHLAKFASVAISQEQSQPWLQEQYSRLLASQLDAVIEAIGSCQNLTKAGALQQTTLLNYLKNNAFRMDYAFYRQQGWLIGSGPIESAHRTVIQQRMKLSGQRWTKQKAQHMLNLRACWLSNQWDSVINQIKKAA